MTAPAAATSLGSHITDHVVERSTDCRGSDRRADAPGLGEVTHLERDAPGKFDAPEAEWGAVLLEALDDEGVTPT
ncbi:MAG: hypothetical protein ACRDQT_00350 [Gaiellaceae bacterium]